MDMMRVETGLKRKKTPVEPFTPITEKSAGNRRKRPGKNPLYIQPTGKYDKQRRVVWNEQVFL